MDQNKIMTIILFGYLFKTLKLVIVIFMVSYFLGIVFYIFCDITDDLQKYSSTTNTNCAIEGDDLAKYWEDNPLPVKDAAANDAKANSKPKDNKDAATTTPPASGTLRLRNLEADKKTAADNKDDKGKCKKYTPVKNENVKPLDIQIDGELKTGDCP
jgi:hypothetical protein